MHGMIAYKAFGCQRGGKAGLPTGEDGGPALIDVYMVLVHFVLASVV